MELIIREFEQPWVVVKIKGKDKRECIHLLSQMDNDFGLKLANRLGNARTLQEHIAALSKVVEENNWIVRWVY